LALADRFETVALTVPGHAVVDRLGRAVPAIHAEIDAGCPAKHLFPYK
jgi:hypothetical protein